MEGSKSPWDEAHTCDPDTDMKRKHENGQGAKSFALESELPFASPTGKCFTMTKRPWRWDQYFLTTRTSFTTRMTSLTA